MILLFFTFYRILYLYLLILLLFVFDAFHPYLNQVFTTNYSSIFYKQ